MDLINQETDGIDELDDLFSALMDSNIWEITDDIIRLSDMPDNVLCKILSCLPTKDAMAAKILSTRWGSLYPFIWIPPIVLDFDDTWLPVNTPQDKLDSFQKFTDKLLDDLQVDVDMLKITCHRGYGSRLSWITSVLRLNVQEVSFECKNLYGDEEFYGIFNGLTSLTRLVLHGGCRLVFQSDFAFPNLRTLIFSEMDVSFDDGFILPNLRSLDIYKGRSVFFENRFINGCPLEFLSLRNCHFYSFCLSIRCPLLRNLTIKDCFGIHSLELDAPNLKELVLKGHAVSSYTVPFPSSFKSLRSAHVDVEFDYFARGIEDLVNACSSTVDMYLCAHAIQALHLASAQLPILNNLNCLTLGYIQRDGWAIMARILYNAPNLEKLKFEQGFCLHDGGYTSFESFVARNPLKCLELHIKEIEFCVFDENEDEVKLVEYFMNNGKVIEALKLRCMPFKNNSTRERLSMLPSHDSKLVFQLK